MKINDVIITEAVYGWDDIKTAASSIANNVIKQGVYNPTDLMNYVNRDRASRMIAKGVSNQWKNTVYELRRNYEAAAKQSAGKAKQNLDTVKSRLVQLVTSIGVSTNNNEVADNMQKIMDATLYTQNTQVRSNAKVPNLGQFKPQGNLNGIEVLNAWTKIVGNAVANTAYKMHNQSQGQPASGSKESATQLGNTYVTKDPMDYGKRLTQPLSQMFDLNELAWHDDAIIPIMVVLQIMTNENDAWYPRRYIKLNGIWYVDSSSENSPVVKIEYDEQAEASNIQDLNLLGQVDLDRAIAEKNHSTDDIEYAGFWGMQRDGSLQHRFTLLPPEQVSQWAKTTNRVKPGNESPVGVMQEIQQKRVQQLAGLDNES
jgi:hypothetical protein